MLVAGAAPREAFRTPDHAPAPPPPAAEPSMPHRGGRSESEARTQPRRTGFDVARPTFGHWKSKFGLHMRTYGVLTAFLREKAHRHQNRSTSASPGRPIRPTPHPNTTRCGPYGAAAAH